MGVEVVGFETVEAPVEIISSTVGDNVAAEEKKENGKVDEASKSHEPIKFGSHVDEPVKKETNGVVSSDAANFPKDAADEWPAQKQVHSFFLVRFRQYDDPKIMSKLDQASIESEKKNQARFKITEQLKAKRADLHVLTSQLRVLNAENRQMRSILGEKIKEIEPIQQALGKLRNANNSTRGVCSSEEELNNMIRSYEYRIQHESIPLSEEKQILREIKQLESTRPQVIANAAVRAKLQESMVHKESLQDQAKVIGGDLDGVRKEQQVLRAKIKQIEDEKNAIDNDISKLQDELAAVTEKRDKALDNVHQIRRQRGDVNSYYYQSRSILNKARDLANRKDVSGLEQFANAEVENFMSLWNSDKSFRDDYEKRILSSLDARQLSRDGRMRNPGEKPIVVVEHHALPAAVEAPPKRAKEQSKPAQAEPEALPSQKAQKDAKNKPKSSKPEADAEKEEAVAEPEKLPVPVEAPKTEKVDAAALKAVKRQEEIAKAKMALERKRKLADKAAAKAAIRAQKEAEKKIKEREKKLKKKAGVSAGDSNTDEGAEADSESGVEAEKDSEAVEVPAAAAAPAKERAVRREMTGVRSRGRARGGPDSIAKAILKRKKATNYWLWAAPAAAVLTLAFAAIGYHYFL